MGCLKTQYSVSYKTDRVWFGTKNGLNRYDGHNFKIFNAESEQENGLKNNFIYGLFEDSKGSIWVGTAGGVYTYDPNTESFTHFDIQTEQGTAVTGPVGEVKEDQDGNIWIAVNTKGFFKYSLNDGTLKQYHRIGVENGNPPPDNTTSIVIDKQGEIWIGTIGQGVFKYQPETEKFIKYITEDQEVIESSVMELQDNGSSLLLGTKNSGVIIMDKVTGKCEPLITKDPSGNSLFIRELFKISDHELWIGTE